MYDFYFGTKKEIESDPKKFLLMIKRMLPRWSNSIPDSEYLALYDCLLESKLPENAVIVETGCGASSIVLLYFALLKNGELYTWDTNGSKLFFLRGVITDTLMRYFNKQNLSNHWKCIAFNSISEYAGIPILKELNKKISACFFDSEHTWDILQKELTYTIESMADKALVAIDDGNYNYVRQNTAYINMIRKKLGLPDIAIENNQGDPFWKKVEEILKKNFKKVIHIQDSYKENFKDDLFWAYFRNDRSVMANLKMEKTEDLVHRFDAWRVQK
ncbi:MAG: class I SAM-dependent methyltransferase [Candidatus Ratteibacteria bacterium]